MRNNDYKYMRFVGERYFDNRFAYKEEIKEKIKHFDFDDKVHAMNSGGTPLISDGHTAYLDDSDVHTLIIGSTGSMKSRAFILPTIISLGMAGENMVISDPKGELFNTTSGFLETKGYKINVLNFRDFEKSDCWNPLHEAYQLYLRGKLSEAKIMIDDMAQIFIGDQISKSQEQFWPMAARDFLAGAMSLLLYTSKDESTVNLASVSPFLAKAYAKDKSESQQEFFHFVGSLPDESTVKINLATSVLNADATKRGILGHVSASLNAFIKSNEVQKITGFNTIDLHEYAKDDSKIATFIIVPDEKTTFHFFCALFVKQLYEILIREASMKEGLKLINRCNFILDEFANIPAIPAMSSMISAARSRNIRFFLVLQSDAQLKTKYGETEAQNIKTNCQTWCFLNSKETPLINEVINYIGFDSQDRTKPLMNAGQLARLEKKFPYVDSVILMNRFRPFISTLADISLYSQVINQKTKCPIYPPVDKPPFDGVPKMFDYDQLIKQPYNANPEEYIKNLVRKEFPFMSNKELEYVGEKVRRYRREHCRDYFD